eukprot:scaffold113513_cov42-Prasinocladus_malaysianus.AAC.1
MRESYKSSRNLVDILKNKIVGRGARAGGAAIGAGLPRQSLSPEQAASAHPYHLSPMPESRAEGPAGCRGGENGRGGSP